jgi:Transglutaminase-like superfamily
MEKFSAYKIHGILTSPGDHASTIEALPDGIEAVLASVRGLFVHVDSLKIYGLDEMEFARQPRTTLSASMRLDRIFEKSSEPLIEIRPIDMRELGTCRDYALMTCAMLRQKQVPARVRCGFARYFSPGKYEDHWICEYWQAASQRWARADAQLDSEHCHHLGIRFKTFDLPEGEFLTAKEAWELVRRKTFPAALFGHGKNLGEWFIWVNLARDLLSLKGHKISDWDAWRTVVELQSTVTDADRVQCDALALAIGEVELNKNAPGPIPAPFWVTRT